MIPLKVVDSLVVCQILLSLLLMESVVLPARQGDCGACRVPYHRNVRQGGQVKFHKKLRVPLVIRVISPSLVSAPSAMHCGMRQWQDSDQQTP